MMVSPSASANVWVFHDSQKRAGGPSQGAAIDVRRLRAKRVADAVHRSNEALLCGSSPSARRISPTSTLRLPSTTKTSRPDLAKQVGLRHHVRPLLDQGAQQANAFGDRWIGSSPRVSCRVWSRSRSHRIAPSPAAPTPQNPWLILRNCIAALCNRRGTSLGRASIMTRSYCERHTTPVRPRPHRCRRREHAAQPGAAEVLDARAQPISDLPPPVASTRDLEGIIPILQEQTIRALAEELDKLNRRSPMQRLRATADRPSAAPGRERGGDWQVEFLADPDGDMNEGAFSSIRSWCCRRVRNWVSESARAESRPSIGPPDDDAGTYRESRPATPGSPSSRASTL